MAQILSPRFSSGDVLLNRQQQKMHAKARKSAMKKTTTKSPRLNATPLEDADEGSDEEEDDDEDLDNEPAVLALPDPAFGHLAGQTEAGADDSDEDYAGIESMSDEEEEDVEEDEGDVLRAAEEDLIDEFERTEGRRNAHGISTEMDNMLIRDEDISFVPLTESLTSNLDMNTDPFVGLQASDSLYQEMWNDAENALSSWRMPGRTNSMDSAGNKKKVRFDDQPHVETHSRTSSMTSEEDPNEAFPDLFTSQDDPLLRERYAIDLDPDATFHQDESDAGSCYDFDGDEERLALKIDEESDSEDSEVSEFSSDEGGDTTDDEAEEESMARMRAFQRARGVMKSPKLAPQTPTPAKRTETRAQSARRPSTPTSARGPRTGTFVLDPTRAAMSADLTGKKVKVIPPAKPSDKDKEFWSRARSAAGSRNISPVSSPGYSLRRPSLADMPDHPFTAQSTLRSMFNGNLDILRNNDVSGIGRDYLPGIDGRPNTSFGSTAYTEGSEGEESPEDIDMHDFIDMAEFESESDEPATGQNDAQDPFDAFTNEGSWGLLDHLEQQRGLVGSFRRNQSQARQLLALPSNPHRRAATLETNALQKGRRAAANTPMTPARKKRGSVDFSSTGAGIKKNVSSPMTPRRPRSRGGSISGSGMYTQ